MPRQADCAAGSNNAGLPSGSTRTRGCIGDSRVTLLFSLFAGSAITGAVAAGTAPSAAESPDLGLLSESHKPLYRAGSSCRSTPVCGLRGGHVRGAVLLALYR